MAMHRQFLARHGDMLALAQGAEDEIQGPRDAKIMGHGEGTFLRIALKGQEHPGFFALRGGSMQRLNIRFEGRVQGVGFRATVADLASGFNVTGRVCNVADGSVDLKAEGEAAELNDFRHAIGRQLDRYIVNTSEHWSDVVQAKWTSFEIGDDQLS